MATVLFMGASISQLAAIRQARATGHAVVAVDADPEAVGFEHADVAEPIDFTDLDRVEGLARRTGVEAVLAISTDRAVPPAAELAERLGLPGIGTETARLMTDKSAMRLRLQERSVSQPAFAIIDNQTDLTSALERVGTPAVLKPGDSGGQRGLYLVSTLPELTRQLPDTLAYSRTGRAMLERYVDGTELNGIVVVRKGEPTLITLSNRLRPPGLGFGVGWIHLYPSDIAPAALDAAGRVACEAVRALGLEDGIAFPQLIVTDAGDVFVVEVAARIPAGQMADLVRLAVGIDLVDIALTQALNGEVRDESITPRFQRPLAIRFLTASPGILPTGTVCAVDGLDDVRKSPGVLDAGLYIQVGETIRPVQVDADRRGYIIATADDPHAALRLTDLAARHLRVQVTAAVAQTG